MNDLNPYVESEFRIQFLQSPYYHQVAKDFDELAWTTNYEYGKSRTTREIEGSNVAKTRFSVVPFYYLNKLLEKNPTVIYDLGCGWNIFKRYIPNIVGVDIDSDGSSFHADIADFVDDEYIENHKDYFESVFSICALHFIPFENLKKRVEGFIEMVKPGGRGFLALNLARMLERASPEFMIDTFGQIKPGKQAIDAYVRKELSNLPCEYLVFETTILDQIDVGMEGNIRLVFER